MGPRLGQFVLIAERVRLPAHAACHPAARTAWRLLAESVCVGLAVRDAAIDRDRRPGPAAARPALLLWLEIVAAVAAAVLGVRLLVDPGAPARATAPRPDPLEVCPPGGRRYAVRPAHDAIPDLPATRPGPPAGRRRGRRSAGSRRLHRLVGLADLDTPAAREDRGRAPDARSTGRAPPA